MFENKFCLAFYQKVVEVFVAYSKSLVEGIIIFIAFYICAIIAKKIVQKTSKKLPKDKKVIFNLLARALKTTIIVIGAITALGTMDINVSALVAGLGLTGFAMGYALKDSLSNLLSGLLILVYQPFKVGYHIEVSGIKGEVEDIDLRYTTLVTESETILVPNTLVFTNTVKIYKNLS